MSRPLVSCPISVTTSLTSCSRLNSVFLVSARRSEEHTSELQSRQYLVCRLLLEKKKKQILYILKDFPEHNTYLILINTADFYQVIISLHHYTVSHTCTTNRRFV